MLLAVIVSAILDQYIVLKWLWFLLLYKKVHLGMLAPGMITLVQKIL